MLSRRNLLKKIVPVLILPMAFFVLVARMSDERAPFFSAGMQDPDYLYLFSSLSLSKLRAPQHIDNPGTTIQLTGAVALRLWHLKNCFTQKECGSFTDAVLLAPEQALKWISRSIIFVAALALGVCGVALTILGFHAFIVLLVQWAFFLFAPVVYYQGRVNPEGYMIVPAALLVAVLAFHLRPSDKTPVRSSVLAVTQGIFLGLGLATKLVFLPLLLTVFFFRSWRDRLLCCLATVVGFAVFAAPVWLRVRYFFGWVGHLAGGTHPDSKLPPVAQVFKEFLFSQPYIYRTLFFLGALYLVMAIAERRKMFQKFLPTSSRVLGILFLILCVQLLLVTRRPNMNYFIAPMLVVLPLSLLCALNSMVLLWKKESQMARGIVAVLFVVLTYHFTYLGKTWVLDIVSVFDRFHDDRVEQMKLFEKYRGTNCTLVGFYTSSLQTYALAYGNTYDGGKYSLDLQRLYPRAVQYNESNRAGFSNFGMPIADEQVRERMRQGDCFLLYGNRGRIAEGKIFLNNMQLKHLESSGNSGIYRLVELR